MSSLSQFSAETDAAAQIGEGKPRRHVLFKEALVSHPEGVTSLYENFRHGLGISKDAPFLGMRQMTEGVAGGYAWMSWQEADERIQNLASGLSKHGVGKDENVGLFSINRSEWVLAEHACFRQSYVTVPLYDTLGDDAIEYIITQTEMKVCLATADKAEKIIKIQDRLPCLKMVVVMDGVSEALKGGSTRLEIVSMKDVEAQGAKERVDPVPPTMDTIATICYTSGTTGLPKGTLFHPPFI